MPIDKSNKIKLFNLFKEEKKKRRKNKFQEKKKKRKRNSLVQIPIEFECEMGSIGKWLGSKNLKINK